MKLRYTPQAIVDLQEIDDYISNVLLNPDAAKRIITSIAQDASRLKENPLLGFDLSKKTGREIDGFTTLWEHHRLDLSVEATVLKPEFRVLFSEEEQILCKDRLKQFGYNVVDG